MKEKSWAQLYKNSNTCQIHLHDTGKMEIVPAELEKNFLSEVSDDKIVIDYSEDDNIKIAKMIQNVLAVSYHID